MRRASFEALRGQKGKRLPYTMAVKMSKVPNATEISSCPRLQGKLLKAYSSAPETRQRLGSLRGNTALR